MARCAPPNAIPASFSGTFGVIPNDVDALPRGVLVGTVEIVGCRHLNRSDSEAACFEIVGGSGLYAWVLDRPKRAEVLEKPTRQPQPMFFNPF